MTDKGQRWRVRARCDRCGDVKVMLGEIVLANLRYAFTCPRCGEVVVRNCSPFIAALLDPPAELDEPHLGPPLEPDDLLDFVLGLGAPDWITELLEAP